jgi:hypothetical protein
MSFANEPAVSATVFYRKAAPVMTSTQPGLAYRMVRYSTTSGMDSLSKAQPSDSHSIAVLSRPIAGES